MFGSWCSPLLFLLLVAPMALSLQLVSVARIPIEFETDIMLTISPGEPHFTPNITNCTMTRLKGFSLNRPGFAFGNPGDNSVTTPAAYINATHATCRTVPVITAGNTSIVLSGPSECDTALRQLCPGVRGAACWNCTADAGRRQQLKDAGCIKGDFKAYCGPKGLSMEEHAEGPPQVEGHACNAGGYQCATFEHYAAFAPAFSRRPYIWEREGAVVVKTDPELAGLQLSLTATVAGQLLSGSFIGTGTGGAHAKLTFDLSRVPSKHRELVNISLRLPDGRQAVKSRIFSRAPAPGTDKPIVPVQVEHEAPGLIIGGIRTACNGWFGGGFSHQDAGLPASALCPAGTAPNQTGPEHAASVAAAAVITQQGRHGVTFVRGLAGLGEMDPTDLDDFEAYEAKWRDAISYMDALASAGVYVLIDIGADRLASCYSGWLNLMNGTVRIGNKDNCVDAQGRPNSTAIARVEKWVFDAVQRTKDHPALAGYYGCDDCCHTVRGRYCSLEYEALARIHKTIFDKYDPYHPMFGTIACGEVWMWQEDGFGLALDVVMKESEFGTSVGDSSFPESQGKLTPGNLRDFPMTHEPVWMLPGTKGSMSALRASAYATLNYMGSSDHNYYVFNMRSFPGWQNNIGVQLVASEMSALIGSARSRARYTRGYIEPLADSVVQKDQAIGTRVWVEEPPPNLNATAAAAYHCIHITCVNGGTTPRVATVVIRNISAALGGNSGPANISITRLFRGTNPSPFNASLTPAFGGTLTFSDLFELETALVYRIGCDEALLVPPPLPNNQAEMCLADCGFEATASAPAMMPSQPFVQSAIRAYPLAWMSDTDDRTRMIGDPAEPYQGRYSLKMSLATSGPVILGVGTRNLTLGPNPVKDLPQRTLVYNVRMAARSRPGGIRVGAMYSFITNTSAPTSTLPRPQEIVPLTSEWTVLNTRVVARVLEGNPMYSPLGIMFESPWSTGGSVWIDDVSIVLANNQSLDLLY